MEATAKENQLWHAIYQVIITIFPGKSGGKLLLCGGSTSSIESDACYRYNNISDSWEHFATMNVPRHSPMVAQINKDVFWLGGNGTSQRVNPV